MLVEPKAAAVRPRVLRKGLDPREPVLLEELVADRLERHDYGRVRLAGPRGSGASTALRHLASLFGERSDFVAWHGVPSTEVVIQAGTRLLVYANGAEPFDCGGDDVWQLSGWSTDDRIEYLLARHPQACANVMARVERRPAWCELDGNALVWSSVLDRLALDPALAGVPEALAVELDELAAHDPDWPVVVMVAEAEFGNRDQSTFLPFTRLHSSRISAFASQRGVRRMVAARTRSGLFGAAWESWSSHPVLSDDDFEALAWAMPIGTDVEGRLAELCTLEEPGPASTALGLLHRRAPERARDLVRAVARGAFEGLGWIGARLPGCVAPRCLLPRSGSELRLDYAKVERSTWSHTRVARTSFTHADFTDAALEGARWVRVDLAEATLQRARGSAFGAYAVSFRKGDLRRAEFANARFHLCWFEDADLREARLTEARIERCAFDRALLEGVDMTGARVVRSLLERADLRATKLDRARMHECWLRHANLEGSAAAALDLSGSTLANALLTGTHWPNADLRGVQLVGAGLNGIDWSGSDLRGADFTGAIFQLGSTRSGLLVGAPAMWGTKTGFYTIDWERDGRRPPEQIRVANLRGADLRGAKVLRCDFHLVDLRGVQCTAEQYAHFERCGAFVDPRR